MLYRGSTVTPTRTHRPGPRLAEKLGWGSAAALPLAFLTLFFVWPVIALLAIGFITDGRLDLSGIPEVSGDARTWRVIGHTLTQASVATLIALVLGIPAAFVLYRLTFKGRGILRALLTVPFVLPTVVVAAAFMALFGPGGPFFWTGLDRSMAAIIIALVFFNVTVVMRTVGGFWSQLDNRPEQAARMLGASPMRAWVTVTLPALAPAIASAASLVFLFCSTSFGVVLVLGGRRFGNIETEIYQLTVQFLDLRSAAVLSLAQFAIVALALIVSSRMRRRRESAVAMVGVRDRGTKAAKQHAPIIAVFGMTVLLLHAVPILTLILRSFQTSGGWTFVNYINLVAPPPESPIDGSVFDAIGFSLRIAVVATLISMVLGILVSLVASRRPKSPTLLRGIDLFDGLVMLPLGVSAVTVGFGLLITMHQPLGIGFDLRTSTILIPVAQAIVALPLVVRTLLPVLRGIDPRLRDAAATLGASPLRVLATIDLALLGRSAGLALGFAFAASLGEFGATAFLVRPGEQTLPVVIAELIGHQELGSYGTGLAAAVVLGGLTAGIMMVAERWRTEGVGEW
ncbi:MAG: ABC transporter permease [Leucobacter sp.]